MKRIYSEKEDLQHKPGEDLESWVVNRFYRTACVRREIHRVNSIEKQVLLRNHLKNPEETAMLVLTFHPALYIIFDLLKSAHQIIEISPTLKSTLSKTQRVAFRNPKTLPDKLVRSKLRLDYQEE